MASIEKQYALAGTVVFNTLLFLLLMFTYMVLSKPVPSEGGILINFGDVESADGLFEPALNDQFLSSSEMQAQPSDVNEGILTQENEEAPAITNPAITKKTETTPVKRPVQTTKPETEKKPALNPKATYQNRGQSATESGTSEGIYKGSGNMGDQTGTTESDNYSEGLGGSGIVPNLNGRVPVLLKEPEFAIPEEGIVVVEITVDKSGKVVSATAGMRGSTARNTVLWDAAKKAALGSKFNVRNDAPDRQVGTITYHFKLQ
jgi:hypothetical protein